ncbi:MAG TPA: hypothetical protein VLA80_11995 [Actinomycetota bacterium]|nr:hypothetical protein [Actinomycetota bacterium]
MAVVVPVRGAVPRPAARRTTGRHAMDLVVELLIDLVTFLALVAVGMLLLAVVARNR